MQPEALPTSSFHLQAQIMPTVAHDLDETQGPLGPQQTNQQGEKKQDKQQASQVGLSTFWTQAAGEMTVGQFQRPAEQPNMDLVSVISGPACLTSQP